MPMRILQVNTLDREGGAEAIAWSLFSAYRAAGLKSWLAVGVKRSADPDVFLISHGQREQGRWARFWWRVQTWATRGHGRWGPWGEKARRVAAAVAVPQTWWDMWRGYESSYYPGTFRVLTLPPERPEILHGHSLQRGYFDLAALPILSRQVPVVLTLHDAWLLSGHCTHSFECERWRTGCGHCPDLTIPPALLRDGTARNWQRKADIFAQSWLAVVTPSQWLMDKVRGSALRPRLSRVIPNGVDLGVFHPADPRLARQALGVPAAARVVLFVANRARRNPWKDSALLEAALQQLGAGAPELEVLVLGVGDTGPQVRWGAVTLRWAGYCSDPAEMARYYQAADVFVHPARADTFPTVVLEALACGTPVVATRVGGLEEQIDDGRTGYLTPPGAAEALAARLGELLTGPERRSAMGAAAAEAARQRFDHRRMVSDYLAFYTAARAAWEQR